MKGEKLLDARWADHACESGTAGAGARAGFGEGNAAELLALRSGIGTRYEMPGLPPPPSSPSSAPPPP